MGAYIDVIAMVDNGFSGNRRILFILFSCLMIKNNAISMYGDESHTHKMLHETVE